MHFFCRVYQSGAIVSPLEEETEMCGSGLTGGGSAFTEKVVKHTKEIYTLHIIHYTIHITHYTLAARASFT